MIQEKNELEHEKWALEQEKSQNAEKFGTLAQSKESLVKEFKVLEIERESLFQLKIQLQNESYSNKEQLNIIENEKKMILQMKESLSKQKEVPSVKENIQLLDEGKYPSFGLNQDISEGVFLQDFISRSELEVIINELQEDVQTLDGELRMRASELDKREKNISEREGKIIERVNELNAIKDSLENSKIELQELINEILPSIEEKTKNLEGMLRRMSEIEEDLQQNFKIIKDEQLKYDSLQFLADEEKFKEIQKIITEKLKKANDREAEIEEFALSTEKKNAALNNEEKNFNERIMEFRAEQESKLIEIEQAKEQVLEMHRKLEIHFKKIDEKEKNILSARELLINKRK